MPVPPLPDRAPRFEPAAPPAELQEELDTAYAVAERLAHAGKELNITRDALQRLRIELCDEEGNVLRVLRPTELLDLAADRLDA